MKMTDTDDNHSPLSLSSIHKSDRVIRVGSIGYGKDLSRESLIVF